MSDDVKITNLDIKNYTPSFSACRFTNTGCILEPGGSFKFDASALASNVTSGIIQGKRVSGNGHIIVNGQTLKLVSKLHQDLSFNTTSSVINISRPDSATGEVLINGLIFKVGEAIVSPEIEDNVNWQNILTRCNPYKRISIVNGKAYASEGAEISNVIEIITKPNNAYVKNDQMIKFVFPCELLKVVPGTSVGPTKEPLYPHIDASQINPTNTATISAFKKERFETVNNFTKQDKMIDKTNENIIFNSKSSDGLKVFKLSNISGSLSNANDNSLIMPRVSSFDIPLSGASPNFQYVVAINAKKINGNGKLSISIVSDGVARESDVIMNTFNSRVSHSRLSSGDGKSHFLRISRPATASGEVLINDILVYRGLGHEAQSIINVNDFNTSPPEAQEFYIPANQNKRFVIVIPSYKNAQWVEKNITSAVTQNYPDYRVIFIDDRSPDNTAEIAQQCVDRLGAQNRTTIIKNKERIGALANLYNAIHSCADDEIVLTLDGDDWLENNNVLSYLNSEYYSGDVWMTYGQYTNHPGGGTGVAAPIPKNVIEKSSFRKYRWCASHLRTFYAGLFKKIRREDLLMPDGTFYAMTWDFAIMFPMLEMAGKHSKYLPKILYVYNLENPINDHKVNRRLQAQLDGVLRNKPKYAPINLNIEKVINIGLIVIATNKYNQFKQKLITSADQNFFTSKTATKYKVTYFVFSDQIEPLDSSRTIKQKFIEHKPFPYASMDRFKHFHNNREEFNGMDYLYYVDVDCLFVGTISEEILGNLVGVRHCGYYNGGGTFEKNQSSCFYLPKAKYKHYYGGGFSGGKREQYLELSKVCFEKIKEDLSKGIMPVWHDETALNWYFAEHPPTISLEPSYHYPQDTAKYKKTWGKSFEPKILLLDKKHSEIRS